VFFHASNTGTTLVTDIDYIKCWAQKPGSPF